MSNKEPSVSDQVLGIYRTGVSTRYPESVDSWPLLSGYNSIVGGFNSWLVCILKHTGNTALMTHSGLGQLSRSTIGFDEINQTNKDVVRSRLERHFRLTDFDAVLLINDGNFGSDELEIMFRRHEQAMGLAPMKIFLSHKGSDKTRVRDFKQTLSDLGFDPWLDEDAMAAGTELEREILQGFRDSCAAVFFVTPSFEDENYLASEVNYAISEKRKKGKKFSIITLVFQESGLKGKVPDLLHTYVWKEPRSDLEALREVIKALPIKVGKTLWKH